MSTVLVGMVVVLLESSVCEAPVRLNRSSRMVPLTSTELPTLSPSLISLCGAPDGGV
ncbi:hypothetical protein D3C81_1533750 [compost metagenome]